MEDFHHLESGHDLAHLSGLDNAPPNRTRQAGSIAHRALDSVRRPFLSPRKHTDVSRDASEYVTVTELDDLDTSSPNAPAMSRSLSSEIFQPPAKSWSGLSSLSRRLLQAMATTSWQMGLRTATFAVLVVLILNVSLTAWVGNSARGQGNIPILLDGDCSKAKSWSTWLHLLINVLSTILLGASNYTIQCLTAPSRAEVARSHAKGDWMDIGTPSFRNLSRTARRRVFLCAILAISSLPLHLLFNSAIFTVLSTNSFVVAVVTESFAQGAYFNNSMRSSHEYLDAPTTQTRGTAINVAFNDIVSDYPFEDLQRNVSSLQRLEPVECMSAYRSSLVSDRRSVLLVTSDSSAAVNGSLVDFTYRNIDATNAGQNFYGGLFDPLSWMCAFFLTYDSDTVCNADDAIKRVDSWTLFQQPIEYCLSEKVTDHCRLQWSTTIMIVVICANIMKLLAMIAALWTLPQNTLAMVGDAAASFLSHPDPTTEGACLLSRDNIVKERKGKAWSPTTKPGARNFAKSQQSHHSQHHQRWYKAPSVKRWALCVLFCVATWGTAIGLLGEGLSTLKLAGLSIDMSSLWKMGFGAVNTRALVRLNHTIWAPENSTLNFVLLANLPQLVLSLLYFTVNGLLTTMCISDEWLGFGVQRTGLRVSFPVKGSAQRSSYFLSLPYKYAIPMLIGAGLLHWLISQSIFLVKIDVFDAWGVHQRAKDITTAGYSGIALIFVLILGAVMLAALVAVGFQKLPTESGMPNAGSCSVVISAACHAPVEEIDDIALKPLMWGAVPDRGMLEHHGGLAGHCCLSSQQVTKPKAGKSYS